MNRYLKARIVLLFGSSEDFAEAIGVNSSIISKVIRGRKVLPERTRNEWARFLGCEPKDIFPNAGGHHAEG
jgi:hypothetical protein